MQEVMQRGQGDLKEQKLKSLRSAAADYKAGNSLQLGKQLLNMEFPTPH